MIITSILLIPFAVFLLVKGAQSIVRSAVYVGKKTGIPRFVIGVTLIAFGTTLPELTINLISSVQGNNELVLGNVLGAVIVHTLLVIGLISLIKPISVKRLVATRDIPFSLASVIIVSLLLIDAIISQGDNNMLTRSNGLILLIVFIIFIYYVVLSHKEHYDELETELTHKRFLKQLFAGLLGFGMLFLGGFIMVESATEIANFFNISNRVIGLTIIAISTSLPELITVYVAIKEGEGELGVGNIIGSNIFNLLFILGLSTIISPILVTDSVVTDIFMMMVSTLLLITALFLGNRNKIDREEGFFFVVVYFIYMFMLFAF